MKLGKSVSVECKTDSNVSWTFNGKSISSEDVPNNYDIVGNKLTIDVVADFNEGLYQCSGDTNKQYAWGGAIPIVARTLILIEGKIFLLQSDCHLFISYEMNI